MNSAVPFRRKQMKGAFRTEWANLCTLVSTLRQTLAGRLTQRRKRSLFYNAPPLSPCG